MKDNIDINEALSEWFELTMETGEQLKLTGNHRVYLPKLNCWRRVDELTENDSLFIVKS